MTRSARTLPSRDESVVTKRTAQAREASGAIDFDAALEAYLNGGAHEDLLRAAGKVIDCDLPFAPERADTISTLTDRLDIEIETYGHAAHAIRHWFFQMREPGARH
jgi:hypothetical protein